LRPAGRRRTLTEPDWFRLAERLIAKGKAVFEDSTVHESEAGTADPKVVALALLARTIGKFEAAVLLLNNGYLVEARTMTRCATDIGTAKNRRRRLQG
jgi:hypothetical protein